MDEREVFYRMYRPNQLSRLVGQDTVRDVLQKTLGAGFVHHAYLLAGQYGSGKTTVARLIALIVNCENRKGAVACLECSSCKAVLAGTSSDVEELDGASSGGIEEVNKIIESSHFPPRDLFYKVFIIDEFHELSKQGRTALLKTVEEPSPHALFILCTTRIDKVPKPLRSRCLKLYFHPIKPDAIAFYLGKLGAHRKVKYEDEACRAVALVADGSMRSALELIQEMEIVSNGNVTGELASTYIGLSGRETLYSMVQEIIKLDLGRALDIMSAILDTNPDPQIICEDMARIFRAIMLMAAGTKVVAGFSPAEHDTLRLLAKEFTASEIASYCDCFTSVSQALEVNVNPRWVMESLVVRIAEQRLRVKQSK